MLAFEAAPVLRTTRLRRRFQPPPPKGRCAFGCGAPDNTVHLLGTCAQFYGRPTSAATTTSFGSLPATYLERRNVDDITNSNAPGLPAGRGHGPAAT